jgi:hypothetical protein
MGQATYAYSSLRGTGEHRLTAQTLSTSSPTGLSSVLSSSVTSPSNVDQSLGSRIAGILS